MSARNPTQAPARGHRGHLVRRVPFATTDGRGRPTMYLPVSCADVVLLSARSRNRRGVYFLARTWDMRSSMWRAFKPRMYDRASKALRSCVAFYFSSRRVER